MSNDFAWMLWLTVVGFCVLKILRSWVTTALKAYVDRTQKLEAAAFRSHGSSVAPRSAKTGSAR